jgi:hypothetical protein
MESESVSRQESPSSAPAFLSRLSFCIAWLFGLEAFLCETGDRPQTPRG